MEAEILRVVKKYGLPMLVTTNESLTEYIQTIMEQVQGKSIRFFRSRRLLASLDL